MNCLYPCRDGADACESEVYVLAATFIRTFYGNDVGIVGSQGVHCFLIERYVLIGGQVAALLECHDAIEIYRNVLVVMNPAGEGIHLLGCESGEIQMIAQTND